MGGAGSSICGKNCKRHRLPSRCPPPTYRIRGMFQPDSCTAYGDRRYRGCGWPHWTRSLNKQVFMILFRDYFTKRVPSSLDSLTNDIRRLPQSCRNTILRLEPAVRVDPSRAAEEGYRFRVRAVRFRTRRRRANLQYDVSPSHCDKKGRAYYGWSRPCHLSTQIAQAGSRSTLGDCLYHVVRPMP